MGGRLFLPALLVITVVLGVTGCGSGSSTNNGSGSSANNSAPPAWHVVTLGDSIPVGGVDCGQCKTYTDLFGAWIQKTTGRRVVAITFQWLYADTGPLNQMLRAIGLGSVARGWLGDFDYALPAVGLIGTWISTGLCMVLLMAGVQRIPITLYEAARVDGCGAIREFFAITLPGLRNELAVVLTITIIAALRSFDIIYVASLGGPGDQTLVPSLVIYRDAFRNNAVGLASAIAIVLTVIILAVAFVVTRLVEDRAK